MGGYLLRIIDRDHEVKGRMSSVNANKINFHLYRSHISLFIFKKEADISQIYYLFST